MLVATPGQPASYPLLSSATGGKICHASSVAKSNATAAAPPSTTTAAANSKSNNNNNSHHHHHHNHHANRRISSASAGVSAAGVAAGSASALMKKLSIRINRGTEILKGAVQKALIVATSLESGAAAANRRCSTISSTASARVTPATESNETSPTATPTPPPSPSPPPSPVAQRRVAQTNASGKSEAKDCMYFKPIRLEPISPWKGCSSKKTRQALVKAPKATKRDGSFVCDPSPGCAQRLDKSADYAPDPRTKADLVPSSTSAFACLDPNLLPSRPQRRLRRAAKAEQAPTRPVKAAPPSKRAANKRKTAPKVPSTKGKAAAKRPQGQRTTRANASKISTLVNPKGGSNKTTTNHNNNDDQGSSKGRKRKSIPPATSVPDAAPPKRRRLNEPSTAPPKDNKTVAKRTPRSKMPKIESAPAEPGAPMTRARLRQLPNVSLSAGLDPQFRK